ncbi:MAG: LysR family transcriptional regulator [Bacteroidota bacterium]
MNYTLHQLSIYLRVFELKSISKAAEEMHLTQPAVSIQLKNFQTQFPLPLWEIVNKKIFFSDFGIEIAKTASRILEEAQNLENKKSAYEGKITGKIKISCVSTGKYVLPYFLSSFLKQNEAVELQLDVSNKSKVIASLENNEVDFSLVSVMPGHLNLKKMTFMQNTLVLVGNTENTSRKKKNNKTFIESLPLIYREEGSATRLIMEKFIDKNKISVRKKITLTSNEAVKQAVIAGLGYSIMPLIGIKNELMNHQLQIIPVEGLPITTNWNLVWLSDKKHAPASKALLQHLKDQKEEIVKSHFSWIDSY